MTEYRSTLDLAAAADLLRATPGPIVVLTHAKPDGDAFGAVVALAASARALDKPVRACLVPPVAAHLVETPGAELTELHESASAELPEAALYVVLDTGAWSQLGPVAQALEPHLDRTLIIDHHLSGNVPAAHRLIDGQAAATCELLAPLIERLLEPVGEPGSAFDTGDETLTRIVCEGLFLGIASDTGWFRFSNTRPQTHELAAQLLRYGVDHAAIYRRTEQSERPQKLALLIRALDSLKLVAGGHAAIMSLNLADFDETGAFEEETERLVDLPQQVGTIQVIVLAAESRGDPDNGTTPVTRLSFRSKPGPEAVNVAEVASHFNGGGHARAAGAKIRRPLAEVLPDLERVLEQFLTAPRSPQPPS